MPGPDTTCSLKPIKAPTCLGELSAETLAAIERLLQAEQASSASQVIDSSQAHEDAVYPGGIPVRASISGLWPWISVARVCEVGAQVGVYGSLAAPAPTLLTEAAAADADPGT